MRTAILLLLICMLPVIAVLFMIYTLLSYVTP